MARLTEYRVASAPRRTIHRQGVDFSEAGVDSSETTIENNQRLSKVIPWTLVSYY